jgi:hypothetical protein
MLRSLFNLPVIHWYAAAAGDHDTIGVSTFQMIHKEPEFQVSFWFSSFSTARAAVTVT